MKIRRTLISCIISIILVVACIFINSSKDEIIIDMGIRSWRFISKFVDVVTIFSLVFTVFCAVSDYLKKKKSNENDVAYQLDVNKDLKNHELRLIFDRLLHSEDWRNDKEMYETGTEFIKQMLEIDDYQSRLNTLLVTNSVKKQMGDWEDVLTRAENKMCLTMRKGINCLQVYSQADRKEVIRKIKEYTSDNQKILDQAKGFIFAVTDFINHSGDTKYDEVSEIGVYKDALLSVIQD